MKKVFLILVLIFATNVIGMFFRLYNLWWFDMSLHFSGGFFMAMFMSLYLADIEVPSKLKHYLIIAGVVSLVGVIWEFGEYLAGQTLIEPLYNNFGFRAYFIGDLDDTINDLLMDILGACLFAVSVLHLFRSRKPHEV